MRGVISTQEKFDQERWRMANIVWDEMRANNSANCRTCHDPQAMDNARLKYPELGYRESAFEAARGADLVLHLTEWAEFVEMAPAALGEVVNERRIVDGRNALAPEAWRAAGWSYRALGRP